MVKEGRGTDNATNWQEKHKQNITNAPKGNTYVFNKFILAAEYLLASSSKITIMYTHARCGYDGDDDEKREKDAVALNYFYYPDDGLGRCCWWLDQCQATSTHLLLSLIISHLVFFSSNTLHIICVVPLLPVYILIVVVFAVQRLENDVHKTHKLVVQSWW